jgi:hypothetical protein
VRLPVCCLLTRCTEHAGVCARWIGTAGSAVHCIERDYRLHAAMFGTRPQHAARCVRTYVVRSRALLSSCTGCTIQV